MDHKEEFLKILHKEDESGAKVFLKSLDGNDRKLFIPALHDICKEYLEYRSILKGTSYTFTRKATDAQASILNIAALICFNERDFRRWASIWQMKEQQISSILEWHCPTWFNKYINSFGEEDFVPMFIRYDWVMELAEKQLITPSKELLVKILPQTLFEQTIDHKTLIKPENLLKWSVTLAEHIWYFFQMNNTVYISDRYLQFKDKPKKQESQWMRCLTDLASQGKIDRDRLLQECVLSTAGNFNKLLVGWYCDLFTTLDPTTEELLGIQPEVLNALNSKHSKPVNTALNAIKKIADDARFNINNFLEAIPLLLSSETKSVVSSTLLILEKIARKRSDKRESVCVACCQAFVHTDNDIQSKAARLIVKNGDTASMALQEAVAQFSESLLPNTKTVLADFLIGDHADNHTIPHQATITQPGDETVVVDIPAVDSFDELIFLSSQAFDNNRAYHIDLLPAALITMQSELHGENIARLEPALQRAFKILTGGAVSTTGILDRMLASFFIAFTKILIERDPVHSKALAELHTSYKNQEEAFRKQAGRYYSPRLLTLSDWTAQNNLLLFTTHNELLMLALEKLRSGNTLPLLSTPTHEPCLISPAALINRLHRYEGNGALVNEIDFQVALSRCDLVNSERHIPLLDETLKGEPANILRFMLTAGSRPQGPFTSSSAWIVAAITRGKAVPEELQPLINAQNINNLTGQFSWTPMQRNGLVDRYNFQKQKYEKVPSKEKTLIMHVSERESKQFNLKSLFSSLKPGPRKSTPTIYDSIHLERSPFGVTHFNDIGRIIFLTPNNPEPVIAQVIAKALIYNNFFQADDQKLVMQTMEALMSIDTPYGETGHLFVSAGMLSADKTIQSFAAELWSKGTIREHIDARLLGQIIGRIQSVEFAPMRRFTDVVSANMLNISAMHNQQLEALMTEILLRLSDEPATGLKKFLELYFQVVSENRSSLDVATTARIKMWSRSPSLKKIAGLLSTLELAT